MTKKIILIAALIAAGNCAWAQKKKVAVSVQGSDYKQCSKLKSLIENVIAKEKSAYTLIERDQEQLSKIENELAYQLSGNVSDNDQLKIGEQRGIEFLVSVTIQTDFMNAKMLNVKTAEVEAVQHIEETNLNGAAYEIAEKVLDITDAYSKWQIEEKKKAIRNSDSEIERAKLEAKLVEAKLKQDAELDKIKAKSEKDAETMRLKHERDIAAEKSKEAVEWRTFLLYRASIGAYAGLMVGFCRHIGGYIQARGGTLSVDMTHFHPDVKFDPEHGDNRSNLYRRSIAAGMMGRAFTNHLHVYLGGGYGMYGRIYKSDAKLPADDKPLYYTEKDGVSMKKSFECEIGAVLSLWRFSFSGGYTMIDPFNNGLGELHFGIGFNF
jgi:hypothetical protein